MSSFPNRVSDAENFGAASVRLKSLISSRRLLKSSLGEPEIRGAISVVGDIARRGGDEERLEAVSLLGKIAEVSKPLADHVHPFLKGGLQSPLPSTGSWGTADDRYYLARGVAICPEAWVASYAATELVLADVAERSSRDIWAATAIDRSDDLASMLRTSVAAFSRTSAENSTDTAARKLDRVAEALLRPLSIADKPVGTDFGEAFSNLVWSACGRNGPDLRALRESTAISFLTLMVEVLRLKFAVSLDADIYRAASIVSKWWEPALPPRSVQLLSGRIAQIGMEALHTLARQGISQEHLRDALVSAFSAEEVNRIGAELASKDPSLNPSVANWLSTGMKPSNSKSNTAVRDIGENQFDELVAQLLISLHGEEGRSQSLDIMADEIAVLEPTHAATIRTAAKRFRLVTQWVDAIAKSRGLSLFGEIDEIVSYDPALYDGSELSVAASARIKVPGITKRLDGRPAFVVVKAQVEKP